ncbi:NAD(P)H-binding protein [Kineococcus sp. NUM-3379]
MRIAVVGGTGVLGRHVVAELRERGHEAVPLSRATGVDAATGAGLDAALEGAEVVLDASSTATTRRPAAVGFFGAVTRNLHAAGARAGVRHLVVVSIVGIDRVPLGYYAGKLEQERVALAGPLPASVLRTTQFHEFAGQVLDRTTLGPLAVVPAWPVRPVAAREVAAALADLAEGGPAGRARPLAGPEVHSLPDLARRVAAARGSRARVLGVRVPGAAGRAVAAGGLLPEGEVEVGRTTFAQWLARQSWPVPDAGRGGGPGRATLRR